MPKINLEDEADNSTAKIKSKKATEKITEEFLLNICPKGLLPHYKKAKTQAQRADFLFRLDRELLAAVRNHMKELEEFEKKLKLWFIQELPDGTTRNGVTGTLGRVELVDKDSVQVEDWQKFYAFIQKNQSFELLNKAANTAAIKERWLKGKTIPGVKKFTRKSVSLTGVKG